MAFTSLEQLRARFAHDQVNSALHPQGVSGPDGLAAEYRTLARGLPALLHGGLLHALAVLMAKDSPAAGHLVHALTAWLTSDDCPVVLPRNVAGGDRGLFDMVLAEDDSSTIWPLNEEARRFARWLKVWVVVQQEGQ